MRLRTVLIELLGLNPKGLAEKFWDFHLSASIYVSVSLNEVESEFGKKG